MEPIVQQPYNLFAQQKQQHYPSSQNQQQAVAPGNAQGATVQDFTAGKLAANSQAQGYGANPITPMEPAKKVEPVKQVKPVEQIKPVERVTQQPITTMEDLAKAMGYTSPQEEERLRKASVANQRILALGDAIRHIGNIANTVNYAPAQQFNSPVAEEQARYEKGKALRDRANQQFYTYQQQKAAQDQKMRQWEAEQEYKRNKDERDFRFNAAKTAADFAERQRQYNGTLEFNKQKQKEAMEKAEADRKLRDTISRRSNSLGWANHNLSKEKFNYLKSKGAGGGSNSGFFVKTPYGRMVVPGKSIPQAQLNQTYYDFENAGWIKRGEFEKRMREIGVANADPDYVRNRIVEEVIAENSDASDYMRDNFGWGYEDDPRPSGHMLMQQQNNGLFSAPWNNGDRQTITGFGSSDSGMSIVPGFGGH